MIQNRVKKYRGANILIVNEFQIFLVIIFWKGKFFSTKIEALKKGGKEYTGKEYLQALDVAYREAKQLIDAIIIQRSYFRRLINIIFKSNDKNNKTTANNVHKEKQESRQEGTVSPEANERKVPSQGKR